MTPPVDELLRRLDAVLAQRAPQVLAALAGPAKATAVAKLEAEFGLALPEALTRCWAIHDGQKAGDEGNALFADFPFCGVASIREQRKEQHSLAKMLGQLAETDDPVAWHTLVSDGVGVIDGPVKARNHNARWLPFGSVNGDVFRYLDFDPAPGGSVGQLIEVDPEGVSWRVLAPSFAAFLQRFVEAAEAGKIDWEDAERGSGALFPRHEGMPAYLADLAPAVAPPGDDGSAVSLAALQGLPAGESVALGAEISRIIGGAGQMDLRLDLDGGGTVWASATSATTKGYAQIRMRTRGQLTLTRLPGKEPKFRITAFSRRK